MRPLPFHLIGSWREGALRRPTIHHLPPTAHDGSMTVKGKKDGVRVTCAAVTYYCTLHCTCVSLVLRPVRLGRCCRPEAETSGLLENMVALCFAGDRRCVQRLWLCGVAALSYSNREPDKILVSTCSMRVQVPMYH